MIYKVLTGVSRRLNYATNLVINTKNAKSTFRVSLYGLGGMTADHSDAIGTEQLVEGNAVTSVSNIATVMIWLDGIIGGGGTFFSSENVEDVVTPTTGSALLWTNTKLTGEEEKLQNHGGCPVLEGKKWVMVKWIYYKNQWEKFPCNIDKAIDEFIPIQGVVFSKSDVR